MDVPRFTACGPMPSVTMEGYVVAFHAPSGATHLLASPAPEILAAIAPTRGPADVDGIVARLRMDYDLDGDAPDSDMRAVVAARLAELAGAGLVRTA